MMQGAAKNNKNRRKEHCKVIKSGNQMKWKTTDNSKKIQQPKKCNRWHSVHLHLAFKA